MTAPSLGLSALALFGAFGLLTACSGDASKGESQREASSPTNEPSTMNDQDATSITPATGELGLVTIDVQKVFFDTAGSQNPQANADRLMTKMLDVFRAAEVKNIPSFITFEASQTGDHALPSRLANSLPPGTQRFTKTTFAATGQPQFFHAVQASGVRRVLMMGAETDVCVMQTMLGLRKAGFVVLAIPDTIFTEEVNDGPARRRLAQAGVVEVSLDEAKQLIASGGPSPSPSTNEPPVILRPLETGIVLNDIAGLQASDPNSSPKLARLRELFYISEWFERPLYAEDPAAATAALPANLKSILKHPIKPLSARPPGITQVVVAGGDAGLADLVRRLKTKGDVQIVEDAVLGTSSAELEPLYADRTAVPTTYKSLYYELTVSVDDRGWPSQQWVQNGETYYDLTQAPEDLPPLHVTP